jgi:hypothetical protein
VTALLPFLVAPACPCFALTETPSLCAAMVRCLFFGALLSSSLSVALALSCEMNPPTIAVRPYL